MKVGLIKRHPWWKRVWAWFHWENAYTEGVWLYQHNTITKQRRAIKIAHAHGPVNFIWLRAGQGGHDIIDDVEGYQMYKRLLGDDK